MDLQPLDGIKVLDLSRVLAGPFCTMNLADLGADVIKVEPVATGDETRTWGPPFVGGESAYFLCVNRNKRSIAVDLKSTEGKRIIECLVKQSDVVIHNFLPPVADKLGVSYNHIREFNQEVIYCSVSGYGSNDLRPGYDYIMQAVGGLMRITGEPQGQPMKVGVAITDLFTGLYATIAIQAALLFKQRTGKGQRIDMALYDAQIAMLANVASNVLIGGKDAPRLGNGHPNIVPYQLFDTADGSVIITVGNNHQFAALCRVFGLDDVLLDPRFQTNELRVANRDTLVRVLSATFKQLTTSQILAGCAEANVPSGPVLSVKEALEAEDTARRDMLWHVNHPVLGDLRLVASPLKLSESPVCYKRVPPRHGEHTVDVLNELGFLPEQVQSWIDKGVLKTCSISH
ncbi:CaiB/BaiF CoA transferase family protein [Alicyclobacillus ferrooxydans]|uniref:CaiB/BaiF CoA transferase family protein n=1 Tax=Alicyclobacillus ferrooxydans TaxID=471514 RepID=UPI001FE0343C|nr:CaiB/BaiF CoA-transferase family protein [Alicyclobacillus ferrooxydans]